jgi:hypothetical protein
MLRAPTSSVEHIAHIAYDAVQTYCRTIGEDPNLPWAELPEVSREGLIAGTHAVLDGTAGTAEAQHERWCAYWIGKGWITGDVKSNELKTHPNLVTWPELPIEQRMKDVLFRAVVLAFIDVALMDLGLMASR